MDDRTADDFRKEPWNLWYPPPLVVGDRVFSWNKWEVILREAAETPSAVQATFERNDGAPDITLRDPIFKGQIGEFLRHGMFYIIIGLGEKYVNPNSYIPSLIATRAIDRRFRWEVLTHGTLAMDLSVSLGTALSRAERERRQLLVHYYRELYFWSYMAYVYFTSPEQKAGAMSELKREANNAAMLLCKTYHNFNAEKYRDNGLPRIDANVRRTGP